MAKADFCFTYYDGDAARDMAHMNRLERGAYTDIIISQRKFGHLTGAQITKILGRDFDECWGAIELILKKDSEEKFFIDWLDASELKAKKQAAHQSENGSKGGRGNKSQPKAESNPTETQIKPLEDGDGIEAGNVFEEEWKRAFDEIWLEQKCKIQYPKIDLVQKLKDFRFKCDSAPTEYHCRDRDGLRLGFLKTLTSPTISTNGTTTKNTPSAEIIPRRKDFGVG